jgi:hypothetical protein
VEIETVKPEIVKTRFGAISLRAPDGGTVRYDHDIVIGLDGRVRKRKKKLSKKVYGTSHTLSQAEAENVYEEGAEALIIGTGQFGRVGLADEAADYFKARKVRVTLAPTADAMALWNEHEGRAIGLFHITC